MLHKYTVDDVLSLVPSRFVRKLTTPRPKKIKPTVVGVPVAPPPTCKSIERFLNSHKRSTNRRRPRALIVDYDLFSPSHELFPFGHFYTPRGVFERHKALSCLDFMLSKTHAPAQLVVQLYVESLWRNDRSWQDVIKEKMKSLRIGTFRAPRVLLLALDHEKIDMADELLRHSDPGGLKEIATELVARKNTTYLEKTIPLLNISSRNDVLFQGLSRLSRFEEYEGIWQFLTAWSNPYKVASKMLYMRECAPADFLLSRSYVPMGVVHEAWRYVQKSGLEEQMPLTFARLQNERITEQMQQLLEEKSGKMERVRKI